ncbi:MAG: DUF4268 domain-containing protein [Planctomycetales bacterium]
MTDDYFSIGDDGELLEMREEPYAAENLLQILLAKYPNLLAGRQISSGEPRRWLLVRREMGVPDTEDGSARWSLDHLFLDQDGVPTLVEAKRSTDPRIRRAVVAQMLDYAANAVLYWPPGKIREEFERRCRDDHTDPATVLRECVHDKSTDQFWQSVESNLQTGRIRLLFVADAIPATLQRIVEFLNEQMRPADVFALEVKQYVAGERRSFRVRIIGKETRRTTSEKSKGTSATKSARKPDPMRLEYWTQFRQRLAAADPNMQVHRGPSDASVDVSFGATGLATTVFAYLAARVSVRQIGVRLRDPGGVADAILHVREQVEAQLGFAVIGAGKLGVPIVETSWKCDPADRVHWPEQHDWLIDKLGKLKAFFESDAGIEILDAARRGEAEVHDSSSTATDR